MNSRTRRRTAIRLEALEDRTLLSAQIIHTFPASLQPFGLQEAGGRLFFHLHDNAIGDHWQFWSAGTGGVQRIQYIDPESGETLPLHRAYGRGLITLDDGLVYFVATDGVHGRPGNRVNQVWSTDGTTQGTERVPELASTPGYSVGGQIAKVREPTFFSGTAKVTFTGNGYVTQPNGPPRPTWGVWQTSGGPPVLPPSLENVNALFHPDFYATVPFEDALGVSYDDLYFVEGGSTIPNLYAYTDSVIRHLEVVESDDPTRSFSNPRYLTLVEQHIAPGNTTKTLFFIDYVEGGGHSLWMIDVANTTQATFVKSFPGQHLSELTSFQGRLFFNVQGGTAGHGLWVFDPRTRDEPMPLSDPAIITPPDLVPDAPLDLTVVGDSLYFSAQVKSRTTGNFVNPRSLWRVVFRPPTDPAGGPSWAIQLVKAFDLGTEGVTASTGDNPSLIAYGDTLLFRARGDHIHGEEFWRSDGTTQGTYRLTNLPGTNVAPSYTTVVDEVVYFLYRNPDFELWAYHPALVRTIAPDTSGGTVGSVSIGFSEPVTGFDLSDLSLTRDGGPNLLTDAQTLTTSDGMHWTLGNLEPITATPGTYVLALDAVEGAGILDRDGIPLAVGASIDFTVVEPPPTLSIAGASVVEGDSGTTEALFEVLLSRAVPYDVTVEFATADGTATTSNGDYVATSGTLIIPAGQLSGTIAVPVNGDTKFEPDETFSVVLSNPSGATIADGTATSTIINDDSRPSISINSVSADEGQSGSTPFVFTVSLSNPSDEAVTVAYATADGTATAGSDYVATSGTLSFAPGETVKTITVLVNGDTLVEPDETFFVNLSAPVNATIARGQGVGTILNDDGLAALSLAATPVVEPSHEADGTSLLAGTSLTVTGTPRLEPTAVVVEVRQVIASSEMAIATPSVERPLWSILPSSDPGRLATSRLVPIGWPRPIRQSEAAPSWPMTIGQGFPALATEIPHPVLVPMVLDSPGFLDTLRPKKRLPLALPSR